MLYIFLFLCKVLIFLFTLIQFYSTVSRHSKVHNSISSFFYWLLQDLVIWSWSVSISKSQRSFWVSFSRTDSWLWIVYHLFVLSNLNFLHMLLLALDDFSLESEWQQVFSGHQNSSQYSSRSQQCCRLGGLGLSSDFQSFEPPPFLSLWGPFQVTITTGITVTLRFHCFYLFSCKVQILVYRLISLNFTLWLLLLFNSSEFFFFSR